MTRTQCSNTSQETPVDKLGDDSNTKPACAIEYNDRFSGSWDAPPNRSKKRVNPHTNKAFIVAAEPYCRDDIQTALPDPTSSRVPTPDPDISILLGAT
jgi:hypothetical protein